MQINKRFFKNVIKTEKIIKKKILLKTGKEVLEIIKKGTPVENWILKNSYILKTWKNDIIITNFQKYAFRVNNYTAKQKPKFFMEKWQNSFLKILKKNLNKEIRKWKK